MPAQITLYLEGDPDQKHGQYMASLLQGALMQMIDREYADYLHQNAFHPYSQYVEISGEKVIWRVSCLSDEAQRQILPVLQSAGLQEVHLAHRDETLRVREKESRSITYEQLTEQYYLRPQKKYMRIRFLSPASFKHDGQYSIFPSARLLFQNLMMKYDAACEKQKIFSEELLGHYEKYAHIAGYRLHSTVFHLEGVKIPSFMGEITLRIDGPGPMVNLARMLLEFGTYSGAGIKTGLGMGGMEIVDEEDIYRSRKRRG